MGQQGSEHVLHAVQLHARRGCGRGRRAYNRCNRFNRRLHRQLRPRNRARREAGGGERDCDRRLHVERDSGGNPHQRRHQAHVQGRRETCGHADNRPDEADVLRHHSRPNRRHPAELRSQDHGPHPLDGRDHGHRRDGQGTPSAGRGRRGAQLDEGVGGWQGRRHGGCAHGPHVRHGVRHDRRKRVPGIPQGHEEGLRRSRHEEH